MRIFNKETDHLSHNFDYNVVETEELKKVSGENYENIVYIDDREDLISQARNLNLQCIKFTGSEKLIVELNLFNVAIPKTKETSQ